MNQEILVIGGAGYIGSHMVKQLIANHYNPIILDNLSTGNKKLLLDVPIYEGCLGDENLLSQLFKKHSIQAVMHFAAFSQVAESCLKPNKYYENNVAKTIRLLNTMVEHNINNFIFSSTAAIFGTPEYVPIDEDHPIKPINPYGASKAMVETLLEDYHKAFNLNYCCLRYFNAAGADPNGQLGECHDPETHLIPIALEVALGKRDSLSIYGNDYETKDGTCIRDYIHIYDIANAHLLALEYIIKQNRACHFNLGNGEGYSVMEIVNAVEQVTGKTINIKYTQRRAGDPPSLIADSDKIQNELGWEPEFSDIHRIIEHAWSWCRKVN